MSDYYDSLITGNSPGRKILYNKKEITDMIKNGYSSVKISKKIGVSYPSVLKYVRKEIPEMEKMLLENGRKSMIRRKQC